MRNKPLTLNDEDRRQWVLNDPGLYDWWRFSRQSLRQFVTENRNELTKVILKALNREPSK